jgi:hypothetical protein
MPQRKTRSQLFELVWSAPLTAVAPQFEISDVALKNTCRRFDIPVPPRGHWPSFRQANMTRVALPPRAARHGDEVVVGGRNSPLVLSIYQRGDPGSAAGAALVSGRLGLVRDRVRKTIGKVSVPRAMTAHHPAIARLIAQDEIRRQKHAAATYPFSEDDPVFDSPFV